MFVSYWVICSGSSAALNSRVEASTCNVTEAFGSKYLNTVVLWCFKVIYVVVC